MRPRKSSENAAFVLHESKLQRLGWEDPGGLTTQRTCIEDEGSITTYVEHSGRSGMLGARSCAGWKTILRAITLHAILTVTDKTGADP